MGKLFSRKEEEMDLTPVEETLETVTELDSEVIEEEVVEELKSKNYRICARAKVPVYASPTKESNIVGYLVNGRTVVSPLQNEKWVKIIYSSGYGWVTKERTLEV